MSLREITQDSRAAAYPNHLTRDFNWLILLSNVSTNLVEAEMHTKITQHVTTTRPRLGKNSKRCSKRKSEAGRN